MIDPRLKKLDDIAGTPKIRRAFSMPMVNAASETSRMNGYMIRSSTVVKATSSAENPGACSRTSASAKMMPSSTIPLMKIATSVVTLLASFQAAASPSVAIFWLKTVTNAVDSAPSAKRSRNRFGMRKAIRKESRLRLAPKSAATIRSRARPSSRLAITARPTTPTCRVALAARLESGSGASFGMPAHR